MSRSPLLDAARRSWLGRSYALVLALVTWPVLAQAWTAELQPTPGESRTASDPIQLELHDVPDDVFDRLTILSFGPNALPGDGAGSDLGTGDDLLMKLN